MIQYAVFPPQQRQGKWKDQGWLEKPLIPLLEECNDQPQTHRRVGDTLLCMDSMEILSGFQDSPGIETTRTKI